MSEKKFFLESKSELQRIGLRAQVVSFLIAQGILEGNVVNDRRDRRRVIVAVHTGESDEAIEALKEELVGYLNNLKQDDPECYGHFPTDIRASKTTGLDNPHSIRLLPLAQLANSLMLEQTSKGVGAMLTLTSVLRPLAALPGAIDGLTARLGMKQS